MSPSADIGSRFKEPSNFDSDYASERERERYVNRFPSKPVNDFDDATGHYTSSVGRSHHYADSEPATKSRYTSVSRSRSRTPSSAKRSRKTSTSTARDLVRALVHERLEADAGTEAQLARSYEIIREETRRAAQAERDAVETAQRLKGLAISRANAQKDAARAQAELRAYKLQLENAQRQLEEANVVVAQSDAERARAEESARKLKRMVEKLRLGEEMRRAREEGLREGFQESYYGVLPSRTRYTTRRPLIEDDDEDYLRTPTSNVPLPIPPPTSEPIMSRRVATPTLRRSQTPISTARDWQGQGTPVPEVIRQQITPPSRRAQTPALPVHPPASIPILSRRAETPGPNLYTRTVPEEYDPFDPALKMQEMNINPVPDHIIVRSPDPVRLGPASQTPPATQHQPAYPARPPSSQTSRHAHASQPHSYPHVHQDTRVEPGSRHHSLGDPAALASASASRIYANYSSSTSSSTGSARSPPPMRPPSRNLRRRDDFPQQETIVPRSPPNSNQNHRFSDFPPVRPPSAADSIPASAAALHRDRRRQSQNQFPGENQSQPRRRTSTSTSSSSSSSVQAFPTPSAVARMRRLPLGERKWSAESGSSVPGITIEPPSRPESLDSIETGIAHPSHMSPFIDSQPVLPSDVQTSAPGWGMSGVPQAVPQQHQMQGQPQTHRTGQPARPAPRTGFAYGSMSPTTGAVRVSASPGMAGGMGFASPPSPSMTPTMNFGAPGTVPTGASGVSQPLRHTNGHLRAPGHRREPARMGDSVDSLPAAGFGPEEGVGVIPPPHPNPYLPSSSSSDEDDDEFGQRAPTPRATTPHPHPQFHQHPTPYPRSRQFDERRAGFDERRTSLAGRTTPAPSQQGGGAFIPPRPPSSAGPSARAIEDYDSPRNFDPRRVPLPASGSTSAYTSRAQTPGNSRPRKTSLVNNGAKRAGSRGRPASRTAFGNTPFVRLSGLADDDDDD